MCGRYFFQLNESLTQCRVLKEKIRQTTIYDFQEGEIFPSQKALVLIPDQHQEYMPCVKSWGIVSRHGNLLINARSEGIEEKYTFRPLLQHRCAIVANGFYEWIGKGKAKEKIKIEKQHQPLCYFAGIYTPKGEFVIITAASYGEMEQIHDRTPIIMNEQEMIAYLHHQRDYIVNNDDLLFEPCEKKERLDL